TPRLPVTPSAQVRRGLAEQPTRSPTPRGGSLSARCRLGGSETNQHAVTLDGRKIGRITDRMACNATAKPVPTRRFRLLIRRLWVRVPRDPPPLTRANTALTASR